MYGFLLSTFLFFCLVMCFLFAFSFFVLAWITRLLIHFSRYDDDIIKMLFSEACDVLICEVHVQWASG